MKNIFDEMINHHKTPKWIKYILTFIVCGAILAFGIIMAVNVQSTIGKILYIVVATGAVAALVSLCIQIHTS